MHVSKSTPADQQLPSSNMRLLVFAFLMVTMIPIYFIASDNAKQSINQQARNHLGRVVNALETTLGRHSYLPALLSEQQGIAELLLNDSASSDDKVMAINRYLEKTNLISGTSDIYLMRSDGLTIASSNWDSQRSFIGRNFSFRPYFQQAMQGRLGRYFALGTTSKERGYYFAYAVRHESQIIGVVTVKIGVEEFEQNWSDEPLDFIVTDIDGVIFMASNPKWRMRSLSPLPQARLRDLQESRRYGDKPITPLSITDGVSIDHETRRITTHGRKEFLVMGRPMQSAGMRVDVLLPWSSVTRSTLLTMIVSFAILGLMSLVAAMVLQHQQERRAYERRSHDELKIKIAERTAELRKIQEELVQAAKMAALGQLAAGINHELNNPLTAIRAYADNAAQFLSIGNNAMVAANLAEIAALTERMASITHQLKIFSRKSHGETTSVSLNTAIQGALAIVQQQIKRNDIQIHWQKSESDGVVQADLVWLEQILVNLLSNAIEAIQAREQRDIWINGNLCNSSYCVSVRDNGAGVEKEAMPNLFEPFFTTKASGQGLGLGLSISYRLAKEMHGSLKADNHVDGGAIFTLTLPTALRENA